MRIYTVHAPPDDPEAEERFLFVKDGFCWPAFFLPIVWILWHRLWLTLIGYIIFILVVAWVGRLTGDNNAMVVAVIGSLLFALEANDIRRWALASDEWRDMGGAVGRNLEEAEIRYFAGRDGDPAIAERRRGLGSGTYARHDQTKTSDGPIFGLFPEPER